MTNKAAHQDNHGSGTAEAADHGDHHDGHIVSFRVLLGTAVALMILTWLTVAIMNIDVGRANVVLALAVAVVKATLVMAVFMHLWWDRAFNTLVLVTSIFAVILFIVFAFTDVWEYEPDIETYTARELQGGDAPLAQERMESERQRISN